MRVTPLGQVLLLIAALTSAPLLAATTLPPPADTAPAKTQAPKADRAAPASAAKSAALKPAPEAASKAVAPAVPAAPPRPVDRELRIVATIDATQTWKKNDPEYPGEQWSKGSATQRIEITTRLRSDGKLQLRNLLDPDLETRMEAKTIFLARQAKKMLEQSGQPFKLPQTDAEMAELTMRMRRDIASCETDLMCQQEKQLHYAAIFAAIEFPQALEEDHEPGRYLYFLPYRGCPEKSRVTLKMAIDGVRYNKDADDFVPFSERHSADTVDASDGLSLCSHFTAVIDTQNAAKPMFQETIFVPRPVGLTEYTENNHTSREQQPQPLIMAVVDWMGHTLRHAPASGKLSASLPLALPLNQNATWLGLWTGTANVTMEWSFKEVPASAVPSKP